MDINFIDANDRKQTPTWDDRYDDGFGFYGLTLNDFKVF